MNLCGVFFYAKIIEIPAKGDKYNNDSHKQPSYRICRRLDKTGCRFYVSWWGVLPSFEPVIWLAVKDEDAHMLASDVYDAFVLIPLYIAMYYKQDLHIHGPVSKKLYKNVTNNLWRILCDFSDDLSRVNVTVDGFKTADGNPGIIGTGISCGVDSLSTVYDRYVKEDDPDYRINALFFMDTGRNGDFNDKASNQLTLERFSASEACAGELGLPIHMIRTNFHTFTYKLYYSASQQMGYFADYSCVFGLQRGIRKYYTSSALSYNQMLQFGRKFKGQDFAEFSESYSVPLIQTEKLELVIDGCQYERTQKIERLSEWDIALKYMSPCSQRSYESNVHHAANCSSCRKCMQVMMTLDAIGKLDKFAGIFDVKEYGKHLRYEKANAVYNHFMKIPEGNEPDIYVFLKKHGVKLPSFPAACIYVMPRLMSRLLKKLLRKIIGEKSYAALKRIVKRNHSS